LAYKAAIPKSTLLNIMAAIPKSTLLNIIHGTNPTIETIQKICGGFDISLGTFFNTDYFYEIYDDE
ncbi:XRE family transcriptional regulator, partial [Ruminococcus sp. AF42-9BH]